MVSAPNEADFFGDFFDISITKPEVSCKHMQDYFDRVGMPSFVNRVEGFELDVQLVNESAEVYMHLDEHFKKKQV